MKKRYTEEQIVKILKEVEATGKPAEACRKYGVSDALVGWYILQIYWGKRFVRLSNKTRASRWRWLEYARLTISLK